MAESAASSVESSEVKNSRGLVYSSQQVSLLEFLGMTL